MKTFTSAIIMTALSVGLAFAGEKSYKVDYVGGSLNLKANAAMKLYIMRDSVELRMGRDVVATIPGAGLNVRIGANGFRAFANASDVGLHIATLGISSIVKMNNAKYTAIGFDWTEDGKARNIVFAAGYDWRQILANLESVTGRKTAGL